MLFIWFISLTCKTNRAHITALHRCDPGFFSFTFCLLWNAWFVDMAFTTDVISCTSEGICSDMWNFCSDNNPHLHDNFMDPPKRIMVSPGHENYPHCSSQKDREAFDIYYGEQTAFQCAYTTSPVIELQTTADKYKPDLNNNVNIMLAGKGKSTNPQQKKTRNVLTVPDRSSERRKSDSDLDQLYKSEAHISRARFLSNGYKSAKSSRNSCQCECKCGAGSTRLSPKCTSAPGSAEVSEATGQKTKSKPKGFKTLLHNIFT